MKAKRDIGPEACALDPIMRQVQIAAGRALIAHKGKARRFRTRPTIKASPCCRRQDIALTNTGYARRPFIAIVETPGFPFARGLRMKPDSAPGDQAKFIPRSRAQMIALLRL